MNSVSFNLLSFTVPVFLAFYSGLSVIVLLGAKYLRDYLLHNPGAEQKIKELSLYETAYYAGGETRVITTAITSLVQQEVILVDESIRQLFLKKPISKVKDPIEQAVSKVIEDNGKIYNVTGTSLSLVTNIGERVSDIVPSVSRTRLIAAFLGYLLPIIALLGLGILKIKIGLSHHEAVDLLELFCFFVALYVFHQLTEKTIRQRERDHVLRHLRQSYNLNRTKNFSLQDPELVSAFAIVGREALMSGPLIPLLSIFRASPYGGWA